MFRYAVIAASVLGLSACGVVYTSPDVDDGSIFGAQSDTDFDVEVIDLTYESAAAANLEPFVPQRLPAAFQPEFVAASRAREKETIRKSSAGRYPIPAPSAAPELRPGLLRDRLPPRLEPRPYTIGVADVLLLSVNAQATLEDLPALIESAAKRQGYVVQDDGAIAIPDVGRVLVAGLSLQDAEAEIFEAVAAAGIDPSFTVEIAEFNSKRVAVGGLVNAPAVVPITLKPLYLNEALQLAGGIAATDPDTSAIQIFRGGQEYQISVDRFFNQPGRQRFLLLDGDTVFVSSQYREAQAQRRFDEVLQVREEVRNELAEDRQLFQERLELGAVPRQYAYIAGEVRSQGRFPLPFETQANLNDVLFGQGQGLQIREADYEEIYVLRGLTGPDQFGGVRAYHLDAENAVNLVAASMFLIRPNDVVFVAEQPITAWNRVISQIVPNLLFQVTDQVGLTQ